MKHFDDVVFEKFTNRRKGGKDKTNQDKNKDRELQRKQKAARKNKLFETTPD